MTEQLGQVIVGQGEVLKQVLIALFCQGHCILEGVPGLAKTLMISSIAQLLSLSFRRIQFTPDLMPSDITGTEILDEEEGTGRRRMRFIKGPIFGHVLLADEINRTPPKTQAALLQAMQEYKVTIAGEDFPLEKPFLVLGTQNPIEQEGTYPLPEAQLDRFMFKILVEYPSFDEELAIAEATTAGDLPTLRPILDRTGILALQRTVRKVLVARSVS
ncbi:MAG: AAA family ATPase, partial [Pirellulales bacterium]